MMSFHCFCISITNYDIVNYVGEEGDICISYYHYIFIIYVESRENVSIFVSVKVIIKR